jgi:hypothetical protein
VQVSVIVAIRATKTTESGACLPAALTANVRGQMLHLSGCEEVCGGERECSEWHGTDWAVAGCRRVTRAWHAVGHGVDGEFVGLGTEDRLRSLREDWHQQGVDVPASVIDDLLDVLRGGLHYEQIIGHVASQQDHNARDAALQEVRGYATLRRWLVGGWSVAGRWLVELVYRLVWRRHMRVGPWLHLGLRYYEGWRGLPRASGRCGYSRSIMT